MYCKQCRNETSKPRGTAGDGAGADRFGSLQCQGCGVLLSPYGSLEALADKLRQLARFGLADPKRKSTTE
jgi:hypothetical protein